MTPQSRRLAGRAAQDSSARPANIAGAIRLVGDGRISAAEYRQLIEAWNGRRTDTDAIFPLLDLDGDGHLSADEFTRLWTDFWVGDDPDAPGTWVFGRTAQLA